MKVFIAGYGYVGQAAGRLFASRGHEVWGARRKPQGRESGVRVLSLDLASEQWSPETPKEIDVIVCALSPGQRSDEAYERAYPKTVSNLLRNFPTARILLISSTTVYAQGNGAEIDERAPANSDHFSAVRIREAEALLQNSSRRHSILRTSGIYGPGRVRLVSRLLESEIEPEARGVYTSRIHRDDLARAIVFIAESASSSGLYLASDPTPATLGEMRKWLLTAHFPVEQAQLTASPASLRRRKNRRVRPNRLLQEGFSFLHPSFREGYSSIFAK